MDKPEYPTMVVPVSEWDELQAVAEKLEAEVDRLRAIIQKAKGKLSPGWPKDLNQASYVDRLERIIGTTKTALEGE